MPHPNRLRLLFISLAFVCIAGCATPPPPLPPLEELAPGEEALLIGNIHYTYEGWFSDEERPAGFTARWVPPEEGDRVLEPYNWHDQSYFRTWDFRGSLKVYHVRPGRYVVLPRYITLGDDSYFVSAPGFLSGQSKEYLGEIKVEAGDVLYFGDITVIDKGGFVFVAKNNFDEAFTYMKKEYPDCAVKLKFKAFTGRHFRALDNAKVKRTEEAVEK